MTREFPHVVVKTTANTYTVTSSRDPHKGYVWDEAQQTCTCPDFKYGGMAGAGRLALPTDSPFRRCRHGMAVRNYILSAPDALRQPTPATLARAATAHLEACGASSSCTACGSVAAAGSPYCAFCQPGVLSQERAS